MLKTWQIKAFKIPCIFVHCSLTFFFFFFLGGGHSFASRLVFIYDSYKINRFLSSDQRKKLLNFLKDESYNCAQHFNSKFLEMSPGRALRSTNAF